MTEETKEVKKPMQTIKFRVHIIRPDKREYKQQSIELFTLPDKNLLVAVQVPCTPEYIANAVEINAEVLGSGKVSDPILTPAGLSYIMKNEFEPHFSDPTPESFEPDEDTDWDNEEETTSSDDSGWDTEDDSDWDSSEDSSESDDDSWSDSDDDWE